MLAAALIVFRETLEAALIVGIVAAALAGVAGSRRWIAGGIAAGAAGALLTALAAGAIGAAFEGIGQEVLNAVILGVAVLMLGWHAIWMAQHGAALAKQARELGANVRAGTATLSAAFVAIMLAVLREGAETVLFLYGVIAGGQGSGAATAVGGLLGGVGGIALGVALYLGFRQISVKRMFAVTGLLIVFLAAAMASQMARQLVQADLLPALATPLWDTARLLPVDSVLGTLAHALLGYDDRPSGVQVVFYAITLATLFFLRARFASPAPPSAPPSAPLRPQLST